MYTTHPHIHFTHFSTFPSIPLAPQCPLLLTHFSLPAPHTTHAHTHTCSLTHTHTFTLLHLHTHSCAPLPTHSAYTYTYMFIQSPLPTFYSCPHTTRTHTFTHAHTCTHTSHSPTFTYMYTPHIHTCTPHTYNSPTLPHIAHTSRLSYSLISPTLHTTHVHRRQCMYTSPTHFTHTAPNLYAPQCPLSFYHLHHTQHMHMLKSHTHTFTPPPPHTYMYILTHTLHIQIYVHRTHKYKYFSPTHFHTLPHTACTTILLLTRPYYLPSTQHMHTYTCLHTHTHTFPHFAHIHLQPYPNTHTKLTRTCTPKHSLTCHTSPTLFTGPDGPYLYTTMPPYPLSITLPIHNTCAHISCSHAHTFTTNPHTSLRIIPLALNAPYPTIPYHLPNTWHTHTSSHSRTHAHSLSHLQTILYTFTHIPSTCTYVHQNMHMYSAHIQIRIPSLTHFP